MGYVFVIPHFDLRCRWRPLVGVAEEACVIPDGSFDLIGAEPENVMRGGFEAGVAKGAVDVRTADGLAVDCVEPLADRAGPEVACPKRTEEEVEVGVIVAVGGEVESAAIEAGAVILVGSPDG